MAVELWDQIKGQSTNYFFSQSYLRGKQAVLLTVDGTVCDAKELAAQAGKLKRLGIKFAVIITRAGNITVEQLNALENFAIDETIPEPILFDSRNATGLRVLGARIDQFLRQTIFQEALRILQSSCVEID